jgi:hypothetical protein
MTERDVIQIEKQFNGSLAIEPRKFVFDGKLFYRFNFLSASKTEIVSCLLCQIEHDILSQSSSRCSEAYAQLFLLLVQTIHLTLRERVCQGRFTASPND